MRSRIVFQLQNIFLFLVKKLDLHNRIFLFNGIPLEYVHSLYNHTFRNERCVEIPIALSYIPIRHEAKILEVGNVLSHYVDFHHDVVDKYEQGRGIINSDIIDYQPDQHYDFIVSISTFEHISFDDCNYGGRQGDPANSADKILASYTHLKKLLAKAGTLLVTVPLGYNRYLDELIIQNRFDFTGSYFFERISDKNHWQQVGLDRVVGAIFSKKPHYWHANALMIGVFENR